MQVLQAGAHKLVLLELEQEFLQTIARQAGFEAGFADHPRHVLLDLSVANRETPLLLFDAADPANLGWFSRCQFYVDGSSGAVLQTPIQLANRRDARGRLLSDAIRVQIKKELPATFRMPNRASLDERTIYYVFYNFLNALLTTGVGVCGTGVVQPLTGRSDSVGLRN